MLGLLCLMVLAACGAAPGAPPAPNTTTPPAVVSAGTTGAVSVSIHDFAFSPQTIRIAVGTTVVWKNLDDEPHTVRGADEQVRSNALDQDETYSVKFDKPGTYKYGCSFHPKMSGTVVVKQLIAGVSDRL